MTLSLEFVVTRAHNSIFVPPSLLHASSWHSKLPHQSTFVDAASNFLRLGSVTTSHGIVPDDNRRKRKIHFSSRKATPKFVEIRFKLRASHRFKCCEYLIHWSRKCRAPATSEGPPTPLALCPRGSCLKGKETPGMQSFPVMQESSRSTCCYSAK